MNSVLINLQSKLRTRIFTRTMMPHGSGAPIVMYANHCYQRQMEASASLETKRESWSSELGMRPEELVDVAYAITKDVDPEPCGSRDRFTSFAPWSSRSLHEHARACLRRLRELLTRPSDVSCRDQAS
jgi:hypothetical protein